MKTPVTKRLLPQLRANGIKVRVRHSRLVYSRHLDEIALVPTQSILENRNDPDAEKVIILRTGGRTTVDLLFPDNTSYTGTATCSSDDNFNRLEGIEIATRRALNARKEDQCLRKFENYNVLHANSV